MVFFFRRVTVDHPIFVIGFGLYGSISHASQYQVHIEIIQATTNKVIASNHTCFTCDGSDSVFRVLFEEPVFIDPNTNYIASASIKVRALVINLLVEL